MKEGIIIIGIIIGIILLPFVIMFFSGVFYYVNWVLKLFGME